MITVTPEVLAKASNELGALSNEMKNITDRMNGLITELGQYWPDQNGKDFITKFDSEVGSKFKDYYNLVEQYSHFIKGAYDKYSEVMANINSSLGNKSV